MFLFLKVKWYGFPYTTCQNVHLNNCCPSEVSSWDELRPRKMTGHESFSLLGVSKILTIDQDLRPPADFGEANLGWDPLIIGDVHHCRRISMRGPLLMNRGLLFKSKDHVIQPLGGISTSLKSVFLILTNTLPSLYQLTQPGSPIDQVH